MTKALIDTDILSYFLKGDAIVLKKFEAYLNQFENINISLITYYEIVSGLSAKDAKKQLEIFEAFVLENSILPITNNSALISAKIYAKLKKTGDLVDDIDLLIAGVAIENQMVLVTNNEKHFKKIPSLSIDNWKKT